MIYVVVTHFPSLLFCRLSKLCNEQRLLVPIFKRPDTVHKYVQIWPPYDKGGTRAIGDPWKGLQDEGLSNGQYPVVGSHGYGWPQGVLARPQC